MNKGLQDLLLQKRTFYILLTVAAVSVLLLISADIFTQSRDGRRQIVDENGGEEVPVDGELRTKEELRLQEILSYIDGVGENRVMITRKEEEETVSVFSSKETKEPKIQGVIVAAQGASSAAVRLSIVEAVSSVYDIPKANVMVFSLKQ